MVMVLLLLLLLRLLLLLLLLRLLLLLLLVEERGKAEQGQAGHLARTLSNPLRFMINTLKCLATMVLYRKFPRLQLAIAQRHPARHCCVYVI